MAPASEAPAEASPSAEVPRGPAFRPMVCQADGCGKDLTSDKTYYQRHRVCAVHLKELSVLVGGIESRFCQQCARFQALEEFDGTRRSCRTRLQQHNARRRCKHDPEALAGDTGDEGSSQASQRASDPGPLAATGSLLEMNIARLQGSLSARPTASGGSGSDTAVPSRRPVRAAALAAATTVAALAAMDRPTATTERRTRRANSVAGSSPMLSGDERGEFTSGRPGRRHMFASADGGPVSPEENDYPMLEFLHADDSSLAQPPTSIRQHQGYYAGHFDYAGQDEQPLFEGHGRFTTDGVGSGRMMPERTYSAPDSMPVPDRAGTPTHNDQGLRVHIPQRLPTLLTQLQQQQLSRKRPGGPGSVTPTGTSSPHSGPSSLGSSVAPIWSMGGDDRRDYSRSLSASEAYPIMRQASMSDPTRTMGRGSMDGGMHFALRPMASDSMMYGQRLHGSSSPGTSYSGTCSPRLQHVSSSGLPTSRLQTSSSGTDYQQVRPQVDVGPPLLSAMRPTNVQLAPMGMAPAEGAMLPHAGSFPGTGRSSPQGGWPVMSSEPLLLPGPSQDTEMLHDERPSVRQRSTLDGQSFIPQARTSATVVQMTPLQAMDVPAWSAGNSGRMAMMTCEPLPAKMDTGAAGASAGAQQPQQRQQSRFSWQGERMQSNDGGGGGGWAAFNSLLEAELDRLSPGGGPGPNSMETVPVDRASQPAATTGMQVTLPGSHCPVEQLQIPVPNGPASNDSFGLDGLGTRFPTLSGGFIDAVDHPQSGPSSAEWRQAVPLPGVFTFQLADMAEERPDQGPPSAGQLISTIGWDSGPGSMQQVATLGALPTNMQQVTTAGSGLTTGPVTTYLTVQGQGNAVWHAQPVPATFQLGQSQPVQHLQAHHVMGHVSGLTGSAPQASMNVTSLDTAHYTAPLQQGAHFVLQQQQQQPQQHYHQSHPSS